MKAKDRNNVVGRIEQEGFDYCFCSYSDFPEVKDVEFQKLRMAYVAAAKELKEYLGCED